MQIDCLKPPLLDLSPAVLPPMEVNGKDSATNATVEIINRGNATLNVEFQVRLTCCATDEA